MRDSPFHRRLSLTQADHALKDPDVAAFWGSEKFQGVRIFLADDLHIVTAKSIVTNKVSLAFFGGRNNECVNRPRSPG